MDYPLDCVEFRDLPASCSLYLFGDYHPHVWLPELRVMSIGATNHHVFSPNERPQGGFVDFDLDKGTYKRVETEAPMFVTVKDKKFPKGYSKGNFYRVYCKASEEEKYRKKISDTGHRAIFVIEEEEVAEKEVRVDVNLSIKPEEVLKKYTNYMGVDQDVLDVGLGYVVVIRGEGEF